MSIDVIHEHMNQIMKTKIGTIITKPILIEPTAKASQAITMLSEADVFDAFCRHNGSTLNVNIRDLLQSKDISHMNIGAFLHPIQSLSENDTIENAVTIITHNRTRAAPVIRDDEVIGVVEAKNILKLISELDNKWIKANQIFTPNPIIINKQTPLGSARRTMVSKRIDHLPVIHKDKVSQVLTSYHLLQMILPAERVGKRDIGSKKIRSLESQVGNLGTNRMASCSPLDNLNQVIDSMLHANTTFCLVLLRTGLQGIITYRDVLNLLVTKQKSTIPLFIVGMPKEDNASIITSKFTKVLDRLAKVYPDIQEARVYVKKVHGVESRYNYEVSTVILTPIKRYIFARNGYDLSKIFDEISGRILRNLAKRAKNRYKFSIRKMM
ncbi:MAG TPA: CBS domain-containing protein [Candidatus Nitrosotenuis sp.]|jgi:CBS domain-containing protein